MPFQIELYSTASERCPVGDFIEKAERMRRQRARIVRTFESLQILQQPPPSMFKKLRGSELWEIKIGEYRFLGYRPEPHRLVLLHAFSKQSQKTPQHEIEVANHRRLMHLSGT